MEMSDWKTCKNCKCGNYYKSFEDAARAYFAQLNSERRGKMETGENENLVCEYCIHEAMPSSIYPRSDCPQGYTNIRKSQPPSKSNNDKPLGALAEEIHENAVAHGFYENGNPPLPTVLMLMVTELAEAMEEYRAGEPMLYFLCEDDGLPCSRELCEDYAEDSNFCGIAELSHKPEGLAVELADCLIRILDTCVAEGIDIDEVVRLKMAYNKTRSYKHGGKVV